MKKIILLFLFMFFVVTKAYSVTCTTISSGNWETPGIWDCGHVPTNSDQIVINTNHLIEITNPNLTYTGDVSIFIYGTLNFNGGKLILGSGSIITIYNGGSITPTGGGNNDKIKIGGDWVWSGHDGPVYGYSVINSGGVLPITFLYLKVKQLNNEMVEIEWATMIELDIKEYIVEVSYDALNYKYIGIVNSNNSNEFKKYNILHNIENNKNVKLYYRIKTIFYNGMCDYSYVNCIYVHNKIEYKFGIYPIPNDGISINFINKDIKNIKLYDIKGLLIIEQVIDNLSQVTLSTPYKLIPGNYVIVIETIDNIETIILPIE